MSESYMGRSVGPGGELLNLSPESVRKGLKMFKVDTEPIGADTLFNTLKELKPLPISDGSTSEQSEPTT